MKKIIKLNQLEDTLQTLNEFSETIDGNNECPMDDCWWHALAYIGSKGTAFDESAARAVCRWYYNGQDIYRPFVGNGYQARELAQNYVNTLTPGSYFNGRSKVILVYYTEVMCEGEIINVGHAVIFDYSQQTNPSNYYYVFDPQVNRGTYINKSEIEQNSYIVYVK